jgi:hypothetical protein
MTVALNVDYQKVSHWVEAIENATYVDDMDNAPVVNLDANFLIPEAERHKDRVAPRLQQMQAMAERAFAKGALRGVPSTQLFEGNYRFRPLRRPDYAEEWKQLKRAWSLAHRGKDLLAQQIISAATEEYYGNDPLDGLQDWLWRFATWMSAPTHDDKFKSAFSVIRPLLNLPSFAGFASFYVDQQKIRSERYSDIFKEYFSGYGDFSQVYFLAISGASITDADKISSIDFDHTRMFYGNTFEAFAGLTDIFAYLNNLKLGRLYNQFERLSQQDYLKLEKVNRFDVFASTPEFCALCEERDNQLRNASHHGGMRLNRNAQLICYRAGKGGLGPEHKIGYAHYLHRSIKLFMQISTLLRLEIMLCQGIGIPMKL